MTLQDPISRILETKGFDVFSVAPAASVFDAISLMSTRHVGALLVLDGHRVLGVISERDYARKVILQGKSSKETLVHEIMTSPVITASPEDTVDGCMQVMTNRRIRHLPVVDADRPVGVVSVGDLVKWIISAHEATIEHLNGYIAGRYPY